MSENKRIVERCLDGFRKLNHEQILDCLADDVEWFMPGAFQVQGKDEFDSQIESDCYADKPTIEVTRLTEESDVVVAEGSFTCPMTDGSVLNARFCDIYEQRAG